MKKYLSFSLAILILFTSCGTVNQSKFKYKDNHKELILSKYGESTLIQTKDNNETWIYDNSSFLQSKRKVMFNNKGRIISNKKTLSTPAYIIRNIVTPLTLLSIGFLLFLDDRFGYGN